MSKEKYILKNQVHFGTLKVSVPKGTVLTVDRDNKTVEISGVQHDNINEVEMCIRAGFIIPYVEGETKVDTEVKISPRAKNKKKMVGEKSDVDSMDKELKVETAPKKASKKSDKIEIIRESESKEERGMKVIASDTPSRTTEVTDKEIMEVFHSDDGEVVAKIPPKKSKPKGVPEVQTLVSEDDKEVLNAINGKQGEVVKTIGKSSTTKEIVSGNKLVAKRSKTTPASEAKAKANAEARKKASEARRAKEKK